MGQGVPATGMRRLLQLAAAKPGLIIAAVILAALAAVAGFIPYIAIYLIVKTVILVWPDFNQAASQLVISYGWLAFSGIVANIILYFAALACSHLAAFGTLYDLKINFATHLARVPLGMHLLVGSGKLRKIMDDNIEKLEGFIAHQLPDLAASFVAPVVMIVVLLSVDWRMGLAAIAGIVITLALQIAVYANERAKVMMRQYQSALDDMNNAAVEYIRGISVVKAFGQTVYSFKRLQDAIRAYTFFVVPYTLSWEKPFSAYIALVNNIYLFVVPVGIIIGQTADTTAWIAPFIFYLIFVPAIASILMKVMYVNSNSMKILGGIEALDAILAEPTLVQPKQPQTVASHDISFNNVHFAYPNAGESEALRGISFTAKQGEVTAIVGPSGGGKSTIAHLIPRFFDVTAGAITIDKVDIRQFDSSYLMNLVSFVFQDVFLFKQTIADNIRLGNPDATDDEVVAAAKAAQCHDFIMALPKGYETVVKTKGVHLSGGECQRLAIARAIIKNAPIVVLDEATAFADPENEHLIQAALAQLMRDKTVIMIAHRLATIKNAAKIIVVEDGKIVEQGTHTQLLSAQAKYNTMWQTYIKTISWNMSNSLGAHYHG